MRYEVFLALRNIRSRRKRRLAQVTALVAVVGIAIGVAALIVVLALSNGFRDEMRAKILQGTSHLNVARVDGQPLENYREVVKQIKQIDGVAQAAGTTYEGAVIIGPKGSSYAVLRGLDGQEPAARGEVARLMLEGASEPLFQPKDGELREIAIGKELSNHTGLKVGDVAEIFSASATANTGQATRRLARVAGVFTSGLYEYDSTWVYLSLDVATVFSGAIDRVPVVSVQVNDIYKVKNVAAEIKSRLGEAYTTVDWQEANRPLFTALALERRMGLLVIAVIIFIAALNITTALILVVTERQRDIAILKAMGATSRSIMSIFVLEGAMIGAAGALLGVVLGLLGCLVGNRFHLVSLPADVYSISNVPFNVSFVDVVTAALVALILSLVATMYPARAASRVHSAEMLREAA
jgi:lipoprotein-releasing system permease protein